MASTYTSANGIELIATGEQSGAWGDTTNVNLEIIDRILTGVGTISLSGTTHTLTTTDGTLSEGMYKVLVLGGSPSGTNTITIAPSDAQKTYMVYNNSGQSAVFSQGSGANVTVANGDTKLIYTNGAGSGAAVFDFTANLAMSSTNITGGVVSGISSLSVSGNIAVTGTVDGRDVAADGTKLNTIETNADVTDTANVTAAGALMDSEVDGDIKTLSLPANTTISAYGKTLVDDADAATARSTLGLGTAATTNSSAYATAAQGTTADAALPRSGGAMTGAITTNSTFDGRDVATDGTKLDGIEASADVTDTTNVTAAGALMDSEVTNLAQVKAFDSSDYATAAQGTLATNALPKAGGTMTGDVLYNDNIKAKFGAGSDLQIYHHSSSGNTYIDETGSGSFVLAADELYIQNATHTETKALFTTNGSVDLYYDNAAKLATTSTGASITGSLAVSDASTTRTNLDVDQAGTALAFAIALG